MGVWSNHTVDSHVALPNILIERSTTTRSVNEEDITIDLGAAVLHICISPDLPATYGNFPSRWSRNDYQPMGQVIFLPRLPIQVRASAGTRRAICVTFQDGSLDLGEGLSDEQLSDALNLDPSFSIDIARRIGAELDAPGINSELLLESYGHILSIELMRRYHKASQGIGRYHEASQGMRRKGGLSPWRMKLIRDASRQSGPPPTLGELATLCSMSTRQLVRAFKEETGLTVGAFARRERLQMARDMLAERSLPIHEISSRLGFKTASAFSAAFKSSLHISPRDVRRLART
jgi:AraC family transcriptional regulator